MPLIAALKASRWFAAALIFFCIPVHAEIPPEALKQATERMRADPTIYDRVDNFCEGRQIKDSCWMPGSVFAGGGAGTCKRQFQHDHKTSVTTIDLVCLRNAKVTIDRKLPAGGFAFDPARCAQMHAMNACKPLDPMASDRFCTGRQAGESCTAELTHESTIEQHDGICTQLVEYQGYGVRRAKRDVILCRAKEPVRHTYLPR